MTKMKKSYGDYIALGKDRLSGGREAVGANGGAKNRQKSALNAWPSHLAAASTLGRKGAGHATPQEKSRKCCGKTRMAQC